MMDVPPGIATDTDSRQTGRTASHITHMGVRGRVQQAANGWLQPFVTSAAPYRSSSL
jgi:hypothetical protein